MALVVKDRVQETTATTGTGTITLGGAVLGYQSFATVGNGNTTYYTIVDLTAGDWEVGIGTYTASGTTLSRDTVLSSSNAGSLVPFGVGTKNVFVTYPSERSVYLDSPGSYPVQSTFNTLTAATATLTAGTVSTTPSSANDLVNKSYVDTTAATSLHYHLPVYVESPDTAGNLNATYNQPGGAGVGVNATLTNAGTKAALTIDGILMTVGKRVLIYNQTNGFENGVYTVTTVGTPDPGGTNWVLTRATDADTYSPSSPNALGQGDAFFVTSGDTGAGETYVCNTVGTITFGTTSINFVQISSAQVYSAGTGLNLSPATTFNISNTGVSAATYGSASQVPVLAVNAQGQITTATNTAIAIAAGAVSGLAASATTDTTDASNITSGTLGTSRLSGSYTGITGVGTLTAGTWNGSTIGAGYGGTGFSSYAVGDLLYADTTSSLAKLADVAVGNALISGGVGAAPSWGKIGLATHISGTLPIANGGTGSTSTTFVNLTTNVTGTLPVANGGTGLATTPSNGQIDIGNGTGFTRTTLTQGSGITITNGAGSITIASAVTSPIPSGTVMIFKQTAAPTGWTKDTTAALNDSALRIVTGTASSGGTVAFTTAFASQSVSGTLSSTTATNQNTTATGSVSSSSSSGLTTATNQATTAGGTVSLSAGGSVNLSGGGSVSGTTLSTSTMPSHNHALLNGFNANLYLSDSRVGGIGGGFNVAANYVDYVTASGAFNLPLISFNGSSGSHSHGFTNPTYSLSNPSYSFGGSSHNHTQDAHNHTISTTSTLTMNAHTHTQDAHSHTFTGTAINLAVKYIDFIIASKD